MSHRGRILLFTALLLSDGLGVVLGLLLGWVARNLLLPATASHVDNFWVLIAWAMPMYLLIFAVLRLYDLDTVLEDSQEYATVATGVTYGILALLVVSTFIVQTNLDRFWLLLSWLGSAFFVALGRFLMRRVVRYFRRRGHLISRALIVGADQQGRIIARQFRNTAESGIDVVGFVDDFLPLDTQVQDGNKVVGHPGELRDLVAEHNIGEVIVVQGALGWETFQELLEGSAFNAEPRIRISPGFYDLLAITPRVAHRNFVPLMMVEGARISGFDRVLNVVMDYGITLFGLVVALPVMMIVWLLLRLGGHGQWFYTLDVLGQGGRPFRAYTFNANRDKRFGSFVRNTGMHNLPLLFSVLAGKMSLVGPRPVQVTERATYRTWLPTLATVRPGVTGPWAVVPVTGMEEEMRAVMYYIRNWTVWLDLQILVQTLIVVLRGRWNRLND